MRESGKPQSPRSDFFTFCGNTRRHLSLSREALGYKVGGRGGGGVGGMLEGVEDDNDNDDDDEAGECVGDEEDDDDEVFLCIRASLEMAGLR